MTYLNKLALIALATAVTFIAVPAQAATSQQDVQTCREAIANKDSTNLSAYRLRFERSKGNNQGRVLTIKAIPNKDGQAFRFTCTLNKNIVTALNGSPVVKFAKR